MLRPMAALLVREGRRRLVGYGLVLVAAMLAGAAAALTKVGIPAAWASGMSSLVAAIAGVVTVRGTSALGEAKHGRWSLPELIRLDSVGRLPLVDDLDDPVRLGVHPAAAAERRGVMTRAPAFISRDVMPQVLLTARLSVRQVMINGNALSPPPSFVAAIPVADGTARSRQRATSKRPRTIGGHHRG